jgi:CheY-like chemotaxis protein
MKPIELLLVEDNPGDVRLTREGLKTSKLANHLSVVEDGADALDFLYRRGKFSDAPRPDLILLDLNLPRVDGRELLATVKNDENLRRIPVVILTSSDSDEDIFKAYNLYANCYITKPVDFSKFIQIVRGIEDFWFSIVKLPTK